MLRYFLLIVLVLGFNLSASAQKKRGQERVDSLLTELSKAKEDTNKVNILDAISNTYRGFNPNEGVKYGEQGLVVAKRLGWTKGQASAFMIIAMNYNAKSDYLKAKDAFDSSITIFKALNDKVAIASIYVNLGNTYEALGNYPMSLEYYLNALKMQEETGNKSSIEGSLCNIGALYIQMDNYGKALEYLNKALKIDEELGDKNGAISVLINIGVVYYEMEDYTTAIAKYREALRISEGIDFKIGMAYSLGNMGNVYAKQKKYNEAISCLTKSMNIARETGDKRAFSTGIASLGEMYVDMAIDSNMPPEERRTASNMKADNLQKAILYLNKSVEMRKSLGLIGALPWNYMYLSEAYKQTGNYKAALEAHEQYLVYKDSVFKKENAEKVTRMEVEGEYQRKQLADSLKNLETKKLSALKLQKQKTYTYIGAGVVLLLLGFSFFIVKNNRLLGKEKQKSEDLLLNILPSEVAMELKDRGATTAKQFDEVTVLFTDFVNFTGAGERMGTEKLVDELHNCFKAFDAITDKYNIEKIKTIGDAYLAVCGLPLADERHAENVVRAAMEIKAFMQDRNAKMGDDTFEIRIGVHSGPVVAGIVGVRKFAYDIWGDTVNTAARMEQNSVAGKINISQTTYELVKDKFACEYRGEIDAKNKGMLKMYFVDELI